MQQKYIEGAQPALTKLRDSADAAHHRKKSVLHWYDGDRAKRIFDVVGALVLIAFFAPVFVLIAIAIALSGSGPILFGHRRTGRDDVPFDCLKFRTMHVDSERLLAECLASDPACRIEWSRTQKLQSDPRVGRVGRILRKSSLDELPQLFNVLRGDMSLVGPRPITKDEIRNYGADYAYYTTQRPGITGLWQVSGRNNTTYPERVALDVEYVSNRTMLGDTQILLRTVSVVLTGHGAY